MLAIVPTSAPQRRSQPADRYAAINAVRISGDQLNRAFQVPGALGEDRAIILASYALREKIGPSGHAVEALMVRMGLVADFLEGPGIRNEDWSDTLETIARVRLVDDLQAKPVGKSGVCFDEAQFDELLKFVQELPW